MSLYWRDDGDDVAGVGLSRGLRSAAVVEDVDDDACPKPTMPS